MKNALSLIQNSSQLTKYCWRCLPWQEIVAKWKKLLKAAGVGLDVTCVSFIKARETRLQNHKYQPIKAFIINYLPVSSLFKNYIESWNEVCLPFSQFRADSIFKQFTSQFCQTVIFQSLVLVFGSNFLTTFFSFSLKCL